MKECVKQAIVRSCVSPPPIHPLMDFHSGRKSRKPQRPGRICAWQQQHLLRFFFILLFLPVFSSPYSRSFYFYIYGLVASGTTNSHRVIRTASKSEYFDSTPILRERQLMWCSSFVTFEPLPAELFRGVQQRSESLPAQWISPRLVLYYRGFLLIWNCLSQLKEVWVFPVANK